MNENQHIPAGYKTSPLGPIPEDWEVKRLGEIITVNSGKDYKHLNNGVIPVYGTGGYMLSVDDKLSDVDAVGIGRKGTIDKPQYLKAPFWTVDTLFFLTSKNGFELKYVFYLSQMVKWKKYSEQTGVPSLTRTSIDNIVVATPPLPEQHRIVSVLSLWDTAIEKQTALLEQLTLRKRGLMQQLLTGKKRLKGFSGEWKDIKLGSVADRITRKNEEDNKNVVTISAQRGFVVQTDFFNKSVASETLDNYFLVHKDEFCYNKSYSNGYPMGAIKRLKSFDKAVVTTLYICFKLKEKPQTNIDFFEQYCESGLLNKELVKVANEGGRAHGLLNVTPADFFNMHMSVPSIEEQTAIASVLVNVDKEIEIANEKLLHLQEEKRGLMQVLLTGKRRVK